MTNNKIDKFTVYMKEIKQYPGGTGLFIYALEFCLLFGRIMAYNEVNHLFEIALKSEYFLCRTEIM